MGAAMLCTFTSIEPQTIESSVAYIDNWLASLEYDRKMLYFAAMQAGKAFEYITDQRATNTKPTTDEKRDVSVEISATRRCRSIPVPAALLSVHENDGSWGHHCHSEPILQQDQGPRLPGP